MSPGVACGLVRPGQFLQDRVLQLQGRRIERVELDGAGDSDAFTRAGPFARADPVACADPVPASPADADSCSRTPGADPTAEP